VRVLVIGQYPPPLTAEARRTMAAVRGLAASGARVEVLAQFRSAAQHRGHIDGPRGAWTVWRRAHSYDAVFVLVDSMLRRPIGRLARLTRLVDCLVWALVLRASPRVRLVVADVDAIPGSIGGRTGALLWNSADRIIVTKEYAKQSLVDAGALAERIEITEPHAEPPGRWREGWQTASDQAHAMDLIHKRAAHDRRAARDS